MTLRPNYIIYAPPYDPDSGGSIFLHELAQALTEQGENAQVWPWSMKRHFTAADAAKAFFRRPSTLWKKPRFKLRDSANYRAANQGDLRPDSIIVYPEVTLNNPLRVDNVARWLLYKPGLKDPFSFGENEMFFKAGEMSDIPEITGGAPDLFLWTVNKAYTNHRKADRSGACYIVRKGHEKPRIPETESAIQIDGMSHEEIAETFNKCEYFYSYDEATLYSQFAAICGCKSVIVPGLFKDRQAWVENHPMGQYGVAYGLDDLDHAIATQGKTVELLRAREALSQKTVENFVKLTMEKFATG